MLDSVNSKLLVGDPKPLLASFSKVEQSFFRKGWFKSCALLHLFFGSLWKHFSKKSWSWAEIDAGSLGSSSVRPIWYIAATGLETLFHGGLPVAISSTVQPRDQISEAGPCSTCFTTSGAIHRGVPLNRKGQLRRRGRLRWKLNNGYYGCW